MTPETPTASTPPAATPEQLALAAAAEARMAQLVALGDVYQANAAMGLYGDSGSGKTSQLVTGIEYGWETYHRITRFYALDPGGFGNKLLRRIRQGLAQVYNPRNHVEAFETMEQISQGYWPDQILDPFTGFADPRVRLVPPHQTRWTVFCPQGHPHHPLSDRKSLSGYQRACPTCNTITTIQNWAKVDEVTVRAPGVKHVGLYCFDSGTAAQQWVMDDMADRAGRDELGGEKGAISKIVSGNLIMGSNNRAHYGFAQNRMQQWINNSRRIAGQVVPPIWTFLELRASDDGGIAVFGPQIAGKAKTTDVASWVGNLVRTSKDIGADQKEHYRLYLNTHMKVSEGNIPHLAKTRAEPGTFPKEGYLEDGPNEPEFTTCSLKYFFIRLDQALSNSLQTDASQYPDAPLFKPFDDDTAEEIVSNRALSQGDAPTSTRALPQQTGNKPGAVARPAVAGTAQPKPATTGNAPAKPVVAAAPAVQPSGAPVVVGKPAAPAAIKSAAPAAPVTQAAPSGKAVAPTAPVQPVAAAPKPATAVQAPTTPSTAQTPVAAVTGAAPAAAGPKPAPIVPPRPAAMASAPASTQQRPAVPPPPGKPR